MDDQVSKVPSQMPPRSTIEFPSLASVGAAVMLGIHPTLSGASLANGLATEKEPHKAGKHSMAQPGDGPNLNPTRRSVLATTAAAGAFGVAGTFIFIATVRD